MEEKEKNNERSIESRIKEFNEAVIREANNPENQFFEEFFLRLNKGHMDENIRLEMLQKFTEAKRKHAKEIKEKMGIDVI